jgi:hypothetical protein
MNFNFPNPVKSAQMIFRLADSDADFLRDVAKQKCTTITEVINVFLRAAIEEFKKQNEVK